MSESETQPVDLVPPVAPEPPIAEPQTPPSTPDGTPEDVTPPQHPLAPGGVRFEQIYARMKRAEAELALEKEAKLRAEIERDVMLRTQTAPAQPERTYSNAELEAMIASGQATREAVDDYREKQMEKHVLEKVQRESEESRVTADRLSKANTSLNQYVVAIPNLAVEGTPERTSLNAEFDWLCNLHGVAPAKLSQVEKQNLLLNAARNVFGSVNTIGTRSTPPRVEPQMGSIGGTPPRRTANPDQAVLDALTPEQVTHYTKMMKTGRYPGGWKEVVEEIRYIPPRASRR
ncbi:MAG: hypothetical protein ACRD2L_22620 [Terriglobia bacterium]